ncbi:hypothetical protein WJX73_006990 [Symbiochloris irregularis]|uniref:Uncharacterized protein n=1 Tax=Symbiochloris irregularis TaxID=706552 RepID=A0AAW1P084_9CHLO
MAVGCVHWYIYGDVDWDRWNQSLRSWCPLFAGALFGAGWWCWFDALVYSHAVLHEGFPFTYHLPGWVATLALVLMNLMSRDDLAEATNSYGGDDGEAARARCWLFISYLVAFGAVAGSVTVLIQCASASAHLMVGVGGLLQCGFILLGGLVLWAFRTEQSDGYGAIY